MHAFVQKVRSGCSQAELDSLTDEVIARICERLDGLGARWAEVDVGQSITLRWSARAQEAG